MSQCRICDECSKEWEELEAEVERLREQAESYIRRDADARLRIDRALELLHGRHESICSTVSYGDQAGCDCACGDAREALEGTTT